MTSRVDKKKLSKAKRSPDQESRKPKVHNRKGRPRDELSSSEEYISSATDSELESELELKVKDDSRRKVYKEKESRSKGERSTAEQKPRMEPKESEQAEKSVELALHMVMRSSVYHARFAPITFPTTSTYIPSSYMMYFVLNSAHNIVFKNTYLQEVAPQYITVASSLYYGYIFFLQILRAKNVSGIINRAESQVLRRFEREYPFESLPIMSPLIMFFQNLGAVKLSDPMYSWICPTLPTEIGTGENVNGIFPANGHIQLPNIPALIRFLFEIGQANDTDEINQNGYLVPASRAAGNNNFFGIDLAANQQGNPDFQRLVYSGGMIAPPEIPDALDINLMDRIQRWNLPNLAAANNLGPIGAFLQTDGNLEWFKNLIVICTEEAKFFKESTTLANITPTTGLSTLIETEYVNQTVPQAIDHFYPFSTGNFPSSIWEFKVSTTRGDTSADEIRIGMSSQFNITAYGQLIPANHAGPQIQRIGPYFDPALGGRQVIQIQSDRTRTPRVAFEQIIREKLYDVTGGQTKT